MRRWKNWLLSGAPLEEAIDISHVLLLLLLSLPGFVILKPVKHILTLNMAKCLEPARYLLNLLGTGCSYSLPIQTLKHIYLLLRRVPPGARWRSSGSTTT